jgi:hypothetical protein
MGANVETDPATSLNDEENLKLVFWLIEMHDNLRNSAESRAATVISADAILLAGATFLLDKVLSGANGYGQPEKVVFAACLGACLVLVASSIAYAASTIMFIWEDTRRATSIKNLPPLLFFHPPDIVTHFDSFDRFRDAFQTSTKKQMLEYALGQLLLIITAHAKRYKNLRKTLRCLLISIIPFLIAIAVSLSQF